MTAGTVLDEIFRPLFASGRIIDFLLALVVVEAIAIALLARLTRRGPSLRALYGNLLSGVFLLLATRAALGGAPWELIAGCLFASFIAHLADLVVRWYSDFHEQ